MNIRKIDRKIERDLLIGMIVDSTFLSRIRSKVEKRFFKNKYARLVLQWILDYFDEFKTPPFLEIQNIYECYIRSNEIDEEEDNLIRQLLEEMSEVYEDGGFLNTDFLISKAEDYFNQVNYEESIEKANEKLLNGQTKEAVETIKNIKLIELTAKNGNDGLCDKEKINEAFEDKPLPLFKFPGDFGTLINDELCRQCFIIFQAPPKGGKTYLLCHFALTALKAGLKVVFFAMGDMTESQMNRRLSIIISKKSDRKKFCRSMQIPYDIVENEDEQGYVVETKTAEEVEPLTAEEAYRNNKIFYHSHDIRKDKCFKLVVRSARELSVSGMRGELDRLREQEGFTPDVVITDYIDLAAPEDSREIGRDRINSTFIAARKLAADYNCLHISATQADANSYSGEIQNTSNFSEDHRKYAHTTATFGMAQTPEEKKKGVIKINPLVLRENDLTVNDVCYVIQCLQRGEVIISSLLIHVNKKEKNEDDQRGYSKRRKLSKGLS